MASLDDDYETLGELLRKPPPHLIAGLVALAHVFGAAAYGDRYRQLLDYLALHPRLDPAGAAEAYREHVMRSDRGDRSQS